MPTVRSQPAGKLVIVRDHPDGPTFRGAARELLFCRDHEVVLAGPAETGKTFACLAKLHNLLADKYPGSQAVMLRKVRDTVFSSVLQTYVRKILQPDGAGGYGGVRVYGGERPQWIDYPGGGRLWIAGIDDPGKALSSERDFVYVNQAEELTLDDWQTLTTRCTGRAGNTPHPQIFGDCNPGPPHHWIKNRASLKVLESRHEDNPTLWDGSSWTEQGRRTLAVLDALTGVRKARLRFGRWVSAEGTVYEFDVAVHRLDLAGLRRFGIAADDDRLALKKPPAVIAGVDWGYTNPGVLSVLPADGDGRLYLVHETYQIRRLIGWWVERAKQVRDRFGVEHFVCDPAEPAYIDEFRRAGLNAVEADNDIEAGIQAVQTRLQLAGDGRPRLYVFDGALSERDEELAESRHPVSTEQEFDAYAWPKGGDGKPVKEKPVDLYNHGMDAVRYAVMWADAHGRSGAGSVRVSDDDVLAEMPRGTF